MFHFKFIILFLQINSSILSSDYLFIWVIYISRLNGLRSGNDLASEDILWRHRFGRTLVSSGAGSPTLPPTERLASERSFSYSSFFYLFAEGLSAQRSHTPLLMNTCLRLSEGPLRLRTTVHFLSEEVIIRYPPMSKMTLDVWTRSWKNKTNPQI